MIIWPKVHENWLFACFLGIILLYIQFYVYEIKPADPHKWPFSVLESWGESSETHYMFIQGKVRYQDDKSKLSEKSFTAGYSFLSYFVGSPDFKLRLI